MGRIIIHGYRVIVIRGRSRLSTLVTVCVASVAVNVVCGKSLRFANVTVYVARVRINVICGRSRLSTLVTGCIAGVRKHVRYLCSLVRRAAVLTSRVVVCREVVVSVVTHHRFDLSLNVGRDNIVARHVRVRAVVDVDTGIAINVERDLELFILVKIDEVHAVHLAQLLCLCKPFADILALSSGRFTTRELIVCNEEEGRVGPIFLNALKEQLETAEIGVANVAHVEVGNRQILRADLAKLYRAASGVVYAALHHDDVKLLILYLILLIPDPVTIFLAGIADLRTAVRVIRRDHTGGSRDTACPAAPIIGVVEVVYRVV